MKTFTDNSGRTWTLAITVDAIKRVQSLVKVNLAQILSPQRESTLPLLTELQADIVLLCDVLFALVKPQAESQQISDEQFGQALGGEAIASAHNAFWEEMISFFQKLPHGQATVAAILKHEELVKQSVKTVTDKINAMSRTAARKSSMTTGQEMAAEMRSVPAGPKSHSPMPGGFAGNLPASSGSTRARTRSANSR